MIVRMWFSNLSRLSQASHLVAVLAICMPLALATTALCGSDASRLPVELRCKVKPARGDRRYKLWKVEIRKATGEPLRQAVVAGGDTARFKNLYPAIYVVCISGEKGRSRCQSVDLVPPPNETAPVFSKEFEVPPQLLNQGDTHQVSASRLSVPEKARKELLRSEEAQLRGDSQQSLRYLERALEVYPKYTEALNNVGTHYHRTGNFSQAIDYFTRVTQLDPQFFAGWVNLGGSLLASGKFSNALEANKRALELRPDDALANSQMGMNYFYLRRFSDAKGYFEKVMSVDPSSAKSPQLFLAHIAFAERRHGEAEGYIRSYLELHPNSPQAPHLRQTLQNLSEASSGKNPEIPQPRR